MKYQSINPATGVLRAEYDTVTDRELELLLSQSQRGYAHWRQTSFDTRSALLVEVADRLEEQVEKLAEIMSSEMGRPIAAARPEVFKCADALRYYAAHGEALLAPTTYETDAARSYVRYDSIGPILAIMPWNFPYWQVIRFSAPSLMLGNPVLLKHAPNTPQCALALQRIFSEAGAPDGVFQSVFVTNEQAAAVIDDRRCAGVTLTGSARAGSEVAAVAGRNLKPMVMELGGSDPFIVLDDAPLAETVRAGVASRCNNTGQTCIAAKRFLVPKAKEDEFVAAFLAELENYPLGNPLHEETKLGPLARPDLRDTLVDQVVRCRERGAEVHGGGEAVSAAGNFFSPAVLTNVAADSPARSEELFGPVAAVLPYESEAELLALANETSYGLGASIWSADTERAEALVPKIDAGLVFVNSNVKSDPRIPFGGTKQSGFGRELARDGMLEFANKKTVWVE